MPSSAQHSTTQQAQHSKEQAQARAHVARRGARWYITDCLGRMPAVPPLQTRPGACSTTSSVLLTDDTDHDIRAIFVACCPCAGSIGARTLRPHAPQILDVEVIGLGDLDMPVDEVGLCVFDILICRAQRTNAQAMLAPRLQHTCLHCCACQRVNGSNARRCCATPPLSTHALAVGCWHAWCCQSHQASA